jgi:hypothetical protein
VDNTDLALIGSFVAPRKPANNFKKSGANELALQVGTRLKLRSTQNTCAHDDVLCEGFHLQSGKVATALSLVNGV